MNAAKQIMLASFILMKKGVATEIEEIVDMTNQAAEKTAFYPRNAAGVAP